MVRPFHAVAVVALLCGALPAAAQDYGGVRVGGQRTLLNEVEQRNPGCPLAETNTLVGVNRAMTAGSSATQRLGSVNGGCRPLVSTQVVAGVNLAVGSDSTADQSLSARSPRGLLATTTFSRGVNIAAGRDAAAGQRILNQTGR